MNILETFPHEVIKKVHLGTYWKYLIKTCGMTYFVFVFDNDMNVLWECVYFDRKSAVYAYNHYKQEN